MGSGRRGGGFFGGSPILIVPSLTLDLRSGGLGLPVRSPRSPGKKLPERHFAW